ncbi:MAG: prepilin-type N-terminal cleavage/methylation domain-containing protein [Candidatus Omnitrophica bacterium]|nr:prepilin-type N-terminal cleavage/methylation domain-containing protein [Candidatus Omnitrophota bacterium]
MNFAAIKNRSFTFIEILFVVIILGILIGISFPQFKKNYHNLLLNSCSGQLQSFMNYLTQHSIVSGEVIYLNIDNAEKRYWAENKEGESILRAYRIPAEIEIESEAEQIAFYPNGELDKVKIRITNLNSQLITLTTKGVFSGVKLQIE